MRSLHRYLLVISALIILNLVFIAGCSSGGGKKFYTGTGSGTGTGTGTGTDTQDPSGGTGGTTGDSTQSFGGRNCMVHVPSSYTEDNCVPLLITWHSLGGQPDEVMSKWVSLSDSEVFIVVAPPHDGSGTDSAHAPDVRTTVAALYNIDLNACYLNGFSEGGQTAFHAGIGQYGWAGIMAFSGCTAHSPPMPNASGMLPVYWVFGDADTTFGGIATINLQVTEVETEGHNVNFNEVAGGGRDLGISSASEAWSWTTNPANKP